MIYFNEFDKFAAQWLRNLYPKATVDERDIRQVEPADVAGFRRVHFFGGVGGWQYALDLAGWGDEPVWSGSCPCQPLSSAGKRAGEKDERHLWPEFVRLIGECRPATIFGEQTYSNDGLEWLDGISLDLEELDYSVGSMCLCAAREGSPHPRHRIWWVAHANCAKLSGIDRMGNSDGAQLRDCRSERRQQRSEMPSIGVSSSGLADDASQRFDRTPEAGSRGRVEIAGGGATGGLELTDGNGQRGERSQDRRPTETPWASSIVHQCTDGKFRRLSAESCAFPLAYGIPRDLGRRIPELRSVAKSARSNRVGRLRGYGNAIVPQVAAVFIRAFMESP